MSAPASWAWTCCRTTACATASRAFTDWPTIPQLYVKGEFVGGSDIVREMFQAGELTGPDGREGRAARAE
jgi:hypothetical protein